MPARALPAARIAAEAAAATVAAEVTAAAEAAAAGRNSPPREELGRWTARVRVISDRVRNPNRGLDWDDSIYFFKHFS